MLDRIIAASLRARPFVAIVALLVALAGTFSVSRMPVDVLPDLDRPVVTVLTEAHGLAAEDVELLVSRPIEQAVSGSTGVFRVRSSSAPGLSAVYVEFDWGTDLYRDRQIVAERLQTLDLPLGATAEMAPVSSIMGQILVIGMGGQPGGTDRMALRRIVEREVQPRLRTVKGVAQVVVTGGRRTELQVEVDAERLAALGHTLGDVAEAVLGANVDVIGGFLERGAAAPPVTVAGRVRAAGQLRAASLPGTGEGGRPLVLGDVADVRLGPSTMGVGDAGLDGEPGVLVVITKQPGVDTVALTEAIEAELDTLRAELPPDVEIVTDVFRQADFIERAIGNVLEAVRDGAVLVVLVLLLFLMNLRTTLITLTAIPLSVATAAIVFDLFGLSIDTMTLGGLAVAIGTLVDDAIVDVENVYRRLHENAAAQHRRSALDVVYDASREVRKPVVYGTIMVAVVYLPLFFLSGVEGRLFAPIGLAYVVSVTASLVVALTVTPVMCYRLLGRTQARGEGEYGSRFVGLLRSAAGRVALVSQRQAGLALGAVAALVLCAAMLLSTRGSTFLPAFNEGTAQVNLMLPPGTSLAETDRYGQALEAMLLQVEGVAHVARRTGRAAGDEHIMPVNVNEALVSFDPGVDRGRDEIIEEIRERLGERFPGIPSETEQPLAHLLSHMLSGVTSQVAIKVEGESLERLREVAHEVERLVSTVEGVRDLQVEPLVLVDQVEVRPDREALALRGVSPGELGHAVGLALGGEELGRMPAGRITYPITVRLAGEGRRDPEALRALRLRSDSGELVRLGDVAEVRMTQAPNEIKRENVARRIVVKHNVAGRALGDVVADVERVLEPLQRRVGREGGETIRLGGQFEAQRAATRVVSTLSVVSVLVIVLVLRLHFGSMVLAMIVLLTRPIAFIGAAAAILVTGQDISVATLVGLIALLGMAARNAILLVEHALRLMAEAGGGFSTFLVVRAARERVVPVTMTALTSGIGLIPLAMAADQPGRELLYPVATVIVGGLVTNTLLDFVVTPAALALFGRKACARRGAQPDA